MFFGRRSSGARRWKHFSIFAGVAALSLLLAGVAWSSHLFIDTAEHTTLEQVVTGGNPTASYQNLSLQQVTRSYQVRDGRAEATTAIPNARKGRSARRRSLTYFGQLTDFQLADEESPGRVERLDDKSSATTSAWRPWEALMPFAIDYSIRQMNLFADASPVRQGNGAKATMDFALMTGDQADSQQRNETRWVRELLEGRGPDEPPINFNSGSTNAADYDPLLPGCASYPPTPAHLAEAPKYTGVQDYDDYDEGDSPYFYDPDDVRGSWAAAGWPTYTGLMNRAQTLSIRPAGLDVPAYVTNGNHDTLVQGNEDAVESFELIATGCDKTLGGGNHMTVPPDPERRYVSKAQVKAVYGANDKDHDHGFAFVNPAEDAASNGTASYYAWNPPEAPAFRFINLDTVSEGGLVGVSSSGNIDDPQFQWLKGELDAASAQGKLILLWGHHPVRSLTADIADEESTPCTGTNHTHGDAPEHDRNPGCDKDPRSSEPIHLGRDSASGDPRESLVELLDNYPHVIAYVSGHTHENLITPFTRTGGGVWWGIETSAVADWPQQNRLIEVMDNRDRTLSIFGTILDHASPAEAPPSGPASTFNAATLAAIGRVFSYNDPQSGKCDGCPHGEGTAKDQNVELLVRDPRTADLSIGKSDSPDPVNTGEQLTYTVTVTNSGPNTATGVKLTDTLPSGVRVDSVTPSKGRCGRTDRTVQCKLTDIAKNRSATVTIKVTPTQEGTITNTASVTGILRDPAPGNNSTSETTTVNAESCPASPTRVGTNGDDTLTGTDAPDRILGGGGNDLITGLISNDCLFGESGRDTIRGNEGDDLLDGGSNRDNLLGGPGVDTFVAGGGDDRILAADGNGETVDCGLGQDTVSADASDILIDCESVSLAFSP